MTDAAAAAKAAPVNARTLGGNRDSVESAEPAEEEECEEVPLDEDVYGAAMFSIVQDFQDIFGGKDTDDRPKSLNIMRLGFTIVVLMTNYGLQFGMLYFIKSFVVEPAQRAIEESSGSQADTLMESHAVFLSCVLSLWVISVLTELRKIDRLMRSVAGLPSCVNISDMMILEEGETNADDKYVIGNLTSGTRTAMMVIIVLPKVLISIGLGVLGFEWLACTTSAADLILNALALGFVVEIDEQLFEALIPKVVKECVTKSVMMQPQKKLTGVSMAVIKARKVADEFGAYGRSLVYFVLPPLISVVFIVVMSHLKAQAALAAATGEASQES